jgi:DNA-binding NtrC family response regulator
MSKILVVDDSPDIRSTLKGILVDAGYDVETASNERDAFDALRRNDSFDFAFMDVRLHEDGEGDESGIYLAKAFQGFNRGGRIIILTGHTLPPATLRMVRLE